MAERLACEMPEAIAGIAPNSAGNQYATTQPCASPKPVIEFHGTADPCWPFDGGTVSCADMRGGIKISVPDTVEGWRVRNGCQATSTTTALPDSTSDGTTVEKIVYDCPAGKEVVFYKITGGGHAWPSGSDSGSADHGPLCTDISANRIMLDFFAGH
jgi:polyhydroxybutyrate depolymerase